MMVHYITVIVMEIRDILKNQRIKLGLTQLDVAQAVGVSEATVSRWESGDIANMKRSRIAALATVLKISPTVIMGWNENKSTNTYPSDAVEIDDAIITFPILGNIAAGYDGIAIEEETGEMIQVPKSLLRGRPVSDYMVLKIKGDSMSPQLLDGDNVIVLRCTTVDSGSIAVIMYDNWDATVKKVKYVSGEDWLEMIPLNPAYAVKRIEGPDLENCRVLGKVVDLIRHFD